MQTKYLKDHYFIESCKPFFSKYTEETNIDNSSLRIYLSEHNKVIDGCNGERTYCNLDIFENIELTDIDSKVVKPFNKTIIKNTEINYITSDNWDTEEF